VPSISPGDDFSCVCTPWTCSFDSEAGAVDIFSVAEVFGVDVSICVGAGNSVGAGVDLGVGLGARIFVGLGVGTSVGRGVGESVATGIDSGAGA